MGRATGKTIRKKQIWDKTNGVCAHCGKVVSGKSATVDHFVPKSWGGGDDARNLMPLCWKCNMLRKDMEIDAFSFYPFAMPWAIRDCLQYRAEWRASRTNADGELLKKGSDG